MAGGRVDGALVAVGSWWRAVPNSKKGVPLYGNSLFICSRTSTSVRQSELASLNWLAYKS